ncbi:hypothetical protein F5Y06DRAFT_301043 [Hypoxylon sp. FL0890]|nr:hypothetical protein F5Y06DRAFT_301043 [Hypoxylon sp. FL0890]
MSTTTRKSSRSNSVDDIDAITPCPLIRSTSEEIEILGLTGPVDKFEESRSPSPCSECSSIGMDASRNRRRASLKALEEGTGGDPGRLWERMLALQQTYGCYNSARMSAALSSGDRFVTWLFNQAANFMYISFQGVPKSLKRKYGFPTQRYGRCAWRVAANFGQQT